MQELKSSPLVGGCPSAEQWIAFQRGEVTVAELDSLAAHLESCQRCLSTFEDHSPGDSIVAALRHPAMDDPFAAEPACRELCQSAAGVSGAGGVAGPNSGEFGYEDSTLRPSHSTLPPFATTASIGPLPEQFGRYRILRKLGEGGMGAVYLAEDTALERRVALKVPTVVGQGARERFLREARAAAGLSHPNICSVYDVGEIGGTCYLTLKFIAGQPLSAVLGGGRVFSEREAGELCRKIAAALAHAHYAGITHRDLKPGNIMLDEQGEPHLMDFGLAKRLSPEGGDLTLKGAVLGTPAYMPPEQARGESEAVGPISDLYSLGVILYELLAGAPPFRGDAEAVLGQIMHSEPKPPSTRRVDVDSQLERICLKAMAKHPADRYRSANELAAALADYLSAPVTGPSPRRRLWTGRRAWLAAAAVVLAVGGLVAVLSRPDGEQQTALQGSNTNASRETASAPEEPNSPVADHERPIEVGPEDETRFSGAAEATGQTNAELQPDDAATGGSPPADEPVPDVLPDQAGPPNEDVPPEEPPADAADAEQEAAIVEANPQDLGLQAIAILEEHCYVCHGQNGANEGGINFILDAAKLVDRKKIAPGDADGSRLLRRVEQGEMPPEDIDPRPDESQVAILRAWIEAGAPTPPPSEEVGRPLVPLADVLTSIQADLLALAPQDRGYQRYFTLTHLHNLPSVRDQDLRLYQAALSKMVNSLSWKPRIVLPRSIDPARTVFGVDLRDLDWDRFRLWQQILAVYPYGLKHNTLPNDPRTQEMAASIAELSGTDLPMVRADWFIATAARPPLYHTLLRLPETAGELESQLNVDVRSNFLRNRLARAGFATSGVSGQNRMIERHEADYGAYWKSYDFKAGTQQSNLSQFPLGPLFDDHPYPDLAFVHAGGEIIFHLPNGLQGYMLVDGEDGRIDEGPIDVVSDKLKSSGTPAIVNGLSCMACHVHGMIREFGESVRRGTAVRGEPLQAVRQLYPEAAVMEELLNADDSRFLPALDRAIGPFLRDEGDQTDIRLFAEPIGPIARWYRLQDLGPAEVAAELGVEPARLLAAIDLNPRLRDLGLGPLLDGAPIKREAWETREFGTSPFQEAARELRLGTPVVYTQRD